MNEALRQLLAISSDPLIENVENSNKWPQEVIGIDEKLRELLQFKNGFFAFESSLHVFPIGDSQDVMTLERWNDCATWKTEYGFLISGNLCFFAQDAFGNQFGIDRKGVYLFHSETGELEPMADSIEGWSEKILEDWRGFTGYGLAHEWQVKNRPLQEGERLIPKMPFVVGGKYEVDNLYAGSILDAMRFRGSLAQQIAHLPDGTKIRIKVV